MKRSRALFRIYFLQGRAADRANNSMVAGIADWNSFADTGPAPGNSARADTEVVPARIAVVGCNGTVVPAVIENSVAVLYIPAAEAVDTAALHIPAVPVGTRAVPAVVRKQVVRIDTSPLYKQAAPARIGVLAEVACKRVVRADIRAAAAADTAVLYRQAVQVDIAAVCCSVRKFGFRP